MTEFLTSDELEALERVIASARGEPGTHTATTPGGEAVAYQHNRDVVWFINSANANVAQGIVPLDRREFPN